jgi:hypothetical protein
MDLNKQKESFTEFFNQVSNWNEFLLTDQQSFTMINKDKKKINFIPTEVLLNNLKIFTSNESNISYCLNNFGFRSESFEVFNDENINILTSGCSNTFGYALPENKIWPNILKDKIAKTNKKNIKLYNLGRPSLDTERIITTCYTFIEKYKTPDYVFLVLPPIERFFTLEREKHIRTIHEPLYIDNINTLLKTFYKNKNFESVVIYNLLSLVNFQKFCNVNNIKLFVLSWSNSSNEFYNFLKIKSVIDNNYINEIKNNIELSKTNEEFWDFAEDNDHHGYKYHLTWANVFYDKMIGFNNNDNSWY